MNKKEYILRSLSNIGLNNKILTLENDLELEKNSYKKIKQLVSELIIKNKKIETEKKELQHHLLKKQQEIDTLKKQLIYNQTIIDKIPKIFLKFILKDKKIKLLEKGIN